MTDWKGHLKIGVPLNILFCLITIPLFLHLNMFEALTSAEIIISILILTISPLLIDIDHPTSKMTYWVTASSLILLLIGYFAHLTNFNEWGIITLSIVLFLSRVFKHRGFIHSITFSLIVGAILYFTLENVWLSLFASFGTWTHLIGDKIPLKIK